MPKHIAEGVTTLTPASVANAALPGDAVNVSTLTRAGFESRVDNTMSFNTGTRTLSIGPTGSAFYVWVNNTRYTYTTPQSATFGTASGEWFFTFNSAGVLTASASPWDVASVSAASVALVYWTGDAVGSASNSGVYCEERHSAYIDRINHKYLHNTRGTAYDNGLSCVFGNANFTASTGRIWDEDIAIDITASISGCRLWHRSGSVMVYDRAVATPYYVSATVPYVDISGALVAVTNGNYFNSWVYATDEFDNPISVVVGQNQYTSITDARAGAQPSLANRTVREWKLLYQAIYRYQGGLITYQEATDWRTASNLPGASSAAGALPASQITYVATSPLTAGTVQGALDQVAATYAYAGIVRDTAPAASGGVGDITWALASGVWDIFSGSAYSASNASGMSASLADGRIYSNATGIYWVIGNVSVEAVGTPTNWNGHLGIFVTGVEKPRWTVAMDMIKDSTTILAVNAQLSLASGAYVDLRIRPSDNIGTFTVHHMTFLAHRVG